MTAHEQLVAALRTSLAACDPPVEVHPGVFAGDNLPERLRAALEELATEKGTSYDLGAHRPGSWEAQHVLALAAGGDPW